MGISKLKIPKICEQCGKPFEAKTVITRFCSTTCVNKSGKEKKREAKDAERKQSILEQSSNQIAQIQTRPYISIMEATVLFNNIRYSDDSFSKNDGYPFPIKLAIDCTDKEQLKDVRVIKELIDQVYQFIRMYWKSVRQQNLPVTIKYPEMVAQIAPHFDGIDIPAFGKDNLWFL